MLPVLRSAKRAPANVRRLNNRKWRQRYYLVGERSRALALLNAALLLFLLLFEWWNNNLFVQRLTNKHYIFYVIFKTRWISNGIDSNEGMQNLTLHWLLAFSCHNVTRDLGIWGLKNNCPIVAFYDKQEIVVTNLLMIVYLRMGGGSLLSLNLFKLKSGYFGWMHEYTLTHVCTWNLSLQLGIVSCPGFQCSPWFPDMDHVTVSV